MQIRHLNLHLYRKSLEECYDCKSSTVFHPPTEAEAYIVLAGQVIT
jgi:hypothetical protein